MQTELKLSPPWVTYCQQIEALFEQDDEVEVLYDEDTRTISIYVESGDKAAALVKLLPAEKQFGNVTAYTKIIPAKGDSSFVDTLQTAFKGNPALSYIAELPSPYGTITYVVFEKGVAQYYNDNMRDPHGFTSTLYQDIAKEVIGEPEGVFFSTDIE